MSKKQKKGADYHDYWSMIISINGLKNTASVRTH